ncbi:hypothetical protein [Leptothoe spongobia]|uniref:Uncharacterized protein n=1 Tax=Leptothoe spongobia TAU-MAC 1115 TaxID=1967444 RepID=A0A947GJI2_9CYAN|nr:hypothetical protein [Leptothoe spongobia]MBT9315672.1 hypothetical protein [Leptothoe spongobia TAU-MAC 1115]
MTRGFLASLLCVFSMATAAQAQMSDVPAFDTDGDFHSARVRGNRGYYSHRQWLVVEPDVEGLNCRNENGTVVLTLAYGAIVDSVFDNGDAIRSINGQPWLKVNVSAMDLRRQVADDFAVVQTCYVRSNNQHIAPLNPDTQ